MSAFILTINLWLNPWTMSLLGSGWCLNNTNAFLYLHYNDVIMTTMASQITSLTSLWNNNRTYSIALQWRHNERNGVSNHRRLDCLLNRLFRRRSKKTSKLRATGLCGVNSPVTGEFPSQRASNAENVSIWWRRHGNYLFVYRSYFHSSISHSDSVLFNLNSCTFEVCEWIRNFNHTL